jgi:hypothetical protein
MSQHHADTTTTTTTTTTPTILDDKTNDSTNTTPTTPSSIAIQVTNQDTQLHHHGFGGQLKNPSQAFIVMWILSFCFLGMGLTFINKLCVLEFPYPNTLLVIQCVVAVVLLLVAERIPALKGDIKVDPLKLNIVIRWIPLVILFIGLLASSLFALKYVTVSTLVVIRNGSSLLVAFLESTILRQQVTTEVIVSLIGIFLGAIIYAISDFSFQLVGYGFLVINLVSTSGYQIYVKTLISDLKLSPFGMAYYNNLLSLVYFVFVALIYEAPLSINWREIDSYTWTIIIASSIFGFGLSLSAFVLNIIITATSQMVINNLNKVALIFISEWYQK